MIESFIRWYSISPVGADHLLMPGTTQAWCGINLANAKAGGARTRCGNCTREMKRYSRVATEPLPAMVTEKVIVHVTRPAGGTEDTATVIGRKLKALRSWKVHIEP